MDSRQRIEAALRHQQPDRTPMFEYVLLSPVADRILGRRYAGDDANWPDLLAEKGYDDAVRQIAIDRVEVARLLGYDMIYSWPNPAPPRPAVPEPPPVEIPDDPVERMIHRNRQRCQWTPGVADVSLQVYVLMRDEMRRQGVDLPIIAPAVGHGVWTDTDLMETMILEPTVAHEHFELATRSSLASIDKFVALGIEQIEVGGDFAGNRLIISPQAYRQFIVPRVRECSRRAHQAGRWVVNASDGDLWPVLDDFLFGCEVDGYLEIDEHAGMDMRRLKNVCRGRITLYGNVDCGWLLSFASPTEVRAGVIDCLEAGEGTGHILSSSSTITASVPLENYLAAVQAYRDFYGLGKLRIPALG